MAPASEPPSSPASLPATASPPLVSLTATTAVEASTAVTPRPQTSDPSSEPTTEVTPSASPQPTPSPGPSQSPFPSAYYDLLGHVPAEMLFTRTCEITSPADAAPDATASATCQGVDGMVSVRYEQFATVDEMRRSYEQRVDEVGLTRNRGDCRRRSAELTWTFQGE